MVTQEQVDEVTAVLQGKKSADEAKDAVLKLDKKNKDKNRSGNRGGSSQPLPSDNPDLVAAVEDAKAQGFNNADIVNSATQNKALLPSQSSRVQEFAKLAQEEGFNNADIANAVTQGRDLLPSQSSKTQDFASRAKSAGASNADIINAATGNNQVAQDPNINPATGRPYGTYEEDTRNAAQKFLDKLSSTQSEVPPANETFSEGFKRTAVASAVGVASAGAGFVKAAVVEPVKFGFNLITSPVETTKGVYKLFTDSKTQEEVRAKIQAEFKERPAMAFGELAGTLVQPETIAKIVEKQPIRVRDVTIPTEAGEVKGKVVAAEFGAESIPLASKFEGKAPKISADISADVAAFKEGTDFKPGSPTETKLYKAALKKIEDAGTPEQVARRQEAIDIGQKIIKQTKGVKSKFIGEVPLSTERLSPEGVQAILKVAQEEKASGNVVLFGSGARRQQIPSSISRFVPRDIDIRLPDASPAALDRVTANAVRSLEEVGYTARRGIGKNGLPDETIEVRFTNEKPTVKKIAVSQRPTETELMNLDENLNLQADEYIHATPTKNVKGILKEGLLPSKNYPEPTTFLAKTYADANTAALLRPKEKFTYLKVKLTKEQLAKVKESDEFEGFSFESTISETVQPSQIKVIKTQPIKERFRPAKASEAGEYVKVAEFKGKDLVTADLEGENAVPDFVLGFKKEGEPFTINNQLVTPLEEELRGVMQGTIRVTKKEGVIDVYPPPKRQKDIGSVAIATETLAESKDFGADSLKANLKRFKELYGYKDGEAPPRVRFDFSQAAPAKEVNSPKLVSPPSPRTYVRAPPQKFESPTMNSPQERSPSPTTKQRFESPTVSPTSSPKTQSQIAQPSPVNSPRTPSPRSSPSTSPRSSSPLSPPSLSPPSLSPPSRSPPSPSPNRSPSPGSPRSVTPRTISQIGTPPRPRLYVINPSKQKQRVEGYDVFVRVRGKFRKVTTNALTEDEAINYGANRVQNTAAATFQIRESSQRAQAGVFNIRERLTDFVRKEGRTFVQKLGKRIQSSGEKREITQKGIITNQTRAKFRRKR